MKFVAGQRQEGIQTLARRAGVIVAQVVRQPQLFLLGDLVNADGQRVIERQQEVTALIEGALGHCAVGGPRRLLGVTPRQKSQDRNRHTHDLHSPVKMPNVVARALPTSLAESILLPTALITRAEAEPLAALLQARGLTPVHVPLISLLATNQPPPAAGWTLVLISSAASAQLAPQLVGALGGARVIAVGQKTAASLRAIGVEPTAVGSQGGAEAVRLLAELAGPKDRVGFIGAAAVSVPLEAALQGLVRPVVRWSVYQNVTPPQAGRLATLHYDAVTLASPSAARRFVRLGGAMDAPVVVIGPATEAAAQDLGLGVAARAATPSMVGLADAVARVLAGPPQPPR